MTTGESAVDMQREVTIETGRKAFRLDGMLDRLLAKAREAMESRNSDRDQEPDPLDYDHFADERRLYQRLLRERNSGGGPGSVNNSWQPWILGIVGALIVASVLGLTSAMFTMTGRMATLETKMDILLKDRK